MVRLDKIYTRGGDGRETSLGDGKRVAKHDMRVAAYGTVDEANAVLGLARLHTGDDTGTMLEHIQNLKSIGQLEFLMHIHFLLMVVKQRRWAQILSLDFLPRP